MRILLYGANPRYESGMGKCGKEVARAMAAEHDVHYFAPSVPAGSQQFEGFTLHGAPGYGDGARAHFDRILPKIEPDLFFTNKNWQSLQWFGRQDGTLNTRYVESGEPTPVVFYGPPVESEEKPPWFEERLLDDHLNDVYLIPFTEPRAEQYHGTWDLSEYAIPEDGDIPSFVPHGVDHDVFFPDDDSQKLTRAEMGMDDRFVVQFVGDNWRRKNIDVLMEAFKIFSESVDGNPVLSLHSPPRPSRGTDEFYSGWHLPRLAEGVGLEWSVGEVHDETDVVWTKEYPAHYVDRSAVASLIDSADVYALATGGEAFSMTTLEAMACETPVVQTEVKTLRWLSGDTAEYVDQVQSTYLNSGERHAIPGVFSLADKLQLLYEDEERWGEMAIGGRERAQDFSWERTRDEMLDVIEWIADDAGV